MDTPVEMLSLVKNDYLYDERDGQVSSLTKVFWIFFGLMIVGLIVSAQGLTLISSRELSIVGEAIMHDKYIGSTGSGGLISIYIIMDGLIVVVGISFMFLAILEHKPMFVSFGFAISTLAASGFLQMYGWYRGAWFGLAGAITVASAYGAWGQGALSQRFIAWRHWHGFKNRVRMFNRKVRALQIIVEETDEFPNEQEEANKCLEDDRLRLKAEICNFWLDFSRANRKRSMEKRRNRINKERHRKLNLAVRELCRIDGTRTDQRLTTNIAPAMLAYLAQNKEWW